MKCKRCNGEWMPPAGKKNLVKLAFECSAVKVLQDNIGADTVRKEIAVKQAVGKLTDIFSVAQDAAERVISEFISAIGWDISEPVTSEQTSSDANSSLGKTHHLLIL